MIIEGILCHDVNYNTCIKIISMKQTSIAIPR